MNTKLLLSTVACVALLAACGDKAPESVSASAPAPAAAPVVAAPVVYQASLSEGIDFKKEGYPSFVAEVSGMSHFESWGRWSDADAGGPVVRFKFKDKLPASFALVLQANAFGPNEGKAVKVKAGQVSQDWVIKNADPAGTYTLKFANVDSDTIEFTPPSPATPKSQGVNEDMRVLGIGFVSLKVQ
jgi:phosphoglycerol transferase